MSEIEKVRKAAGEASRDLMNAIADSLGAEIKAMADKLDSQEQRNMAGHLVIGDLSNRIAITVFLHLGAYGFVEED